MIRADAASGTVFQGAGLEVLVGGLGNITASAPGTGAPDVFQTLVVNDVDRGGAFTVLFGRKRVPLAAQRHSWGFSVTRGSRRA